MSLANVDKLVNSGALDDEIAAFGWFELELPDGNPLWELKMAPKEGRSQERDDAKAAHAQRVAEYAARVAAGLPLFDEPETPSEEEPQDEWAHFFGGATPTQRLAL